MLPTITEKLPKNAKTNKQRIGMSKTGIRLGIGIGGLLLGVTAKRFGLVAGLSVNAHMDRRQIAGDQWDHKRKIGLTGVPLEV